MRDEETPHPLPEGQVPHADGMEIMLSPAKTSTSKAGLLHALPSPRTTAGTVRVNQINM